ncbi:hypothetical protein HHI36_023033, partial [Cryptolaemus montrouzieri]
LVFDGASSHLDFTIAEKADNLGITLFCLPSNTTHELQPLDKAVFRSFEAHWDNELLRYWDANPQRSLNKARFNIILSRVWPKCMTPDNIINGFKATGLFPLNSEAIHESAFAPSLPSQRDMKRSILNNSPTPNTQDQVLPDYDTHLSSDEDDMTLAVIAHRTKKILIICLLT